jgi:nitroreductase
MEAIELLTTRASNSKLSDPEPDAETLRLAFEAASRAPDHQNLKPWRVYVVRGQARTELGELMAATVRRKQPSASSDELDKVRRKALRAPLILVVAAVVEPHPKLPAVEQLLAAGAAAHAILLTLQARQYAGVWRTGDSAYDPDFKQAFGLREQDAIVGFLYTGTAKLPPGNFDRPGPDTFVREWTGATTPR